MAKSEEWPEEWTDDKSEDIMADALGAFRGRVIAYANLNGRAATLATFPNPEVVEEIFEELDESQTAGLN